MSKRGGGSRPPPSPITLSNWASSPPAFPSLPEEVSHDHDDDEELEQENTDVPLLEYNVVSLTDSLPPRLLSLLLQPSASPTRGSSQRSSEKLMVQDLTALVCDGMDLLTPAELAVLQRVYREEADPRGLDLNTFRKVRSR